MKNFKVKWLLLSIILSIASINTAWAGNNCDFWSDNPGAITFTANGNSKTMSFSKSSGVSDYTDIGTVSSLSISSFWIKTWKKSDGNVCQIEMYYAIHTSKNVWAGDDSDKHQLNALHDGSYNDYWQDGSCNQQWLFSGSENLLSNLTPGTTYWIDFYFEINGNSGSSSGCYGAQKIMNNGSNNFHASFTVADAKTTFTAGDYLYLDARNQTNWQSADFTARFYFKRYDKADEDLDGGNVNCTNLQKIEDWVYYVEVPEGDYNGKIKVDRVNPSNIDTKWCETSIIAASGRSSALENCLGGSGSDCGWTPSWGTYCPPKATSNISDNGTVKTWGGSGTSGSPYYVATGSQIKVSAASTNTLPDGNMTTKYDFQVRNTSNAQQAHSDGTATTYSYSVPATNNVTYKVRVNAYNSYNSASSTAKWSDASEIYYTARTPYNIAYNKGSNGTGDNVTDVKLNGISITLRGVTYTRTGYTQTAWNTNSAGTGGTNYNLSASYTGNAALSLYPTWTANTTTVTLNANTANHGSGANQSVTATYDAALPSFTATTPATGYHLVGYYTNATSGTKVINADGTFATNSGVWNRTDGSTLTLWAHYELNTFTVHFNDNYPSGTTGSGSMSNESFTYNTSKNLTANAFTCEGYDFAGWKIDNDGDVIAGGSNGCTLTTEHGVTVQLYAQWDDNNEYYFKGVTSTDWNTASNWTKGAVPNDDDHEVYIFAPVKISSGTIHVKSVDIITAGSYSPSVGSSVAAASSKLTIGAGAMLIVDGKIQNYDKSTSKADSTRASTLHIESGATGNGALVWGETNSTPGYAQVDFYTKSHGEKDENSSINQYIGTPFSNDQSILYQYYYSWLFKIKRTAGVLDWHLMSGDESMNEFEGYNLITAYDKGTVYQMEGILVSNEDVELNGSSTPALVYTSGTGSNPNNENVLANSWVAPILIKNFVDDDFTNVDKSIYIFNAGSPNDALSVGEAGNYTTYSISTIKENETNEVIPSMQSFSVYTSGESPSLTLNYSNLVKANASNSLIEPNHAPSRYSNNQMDLLKVRVEGANGWADVLKVYIRDDFSTDFENGWDAHKMYGYPEAPQLYAVTTDGNMAINCVPTADNNVLGFTPGSEDNEYTFSFTYDGDEEYYLKDTKLNIETLINTEATYTFTSEAEDSDMRFIIIKRAPAVATDAETVSGDRLAVSGVQKIMHNGQLYIIRDGGIYSTDGQMVK